MTVPVEVQLRQALAAKQELERLADEHREEVRKLHSQLRLLSSNSVEATAAQKELSLMRRQNTELQQRFSLLSARASSAEKACDLLKEQVAIYTSTTQMSDLVEELASLRQTMSEREREADSQKEDMRRELQEAVDAANSRIISMQDRILRAESQRDIAQCELRKAQQRLAATQARAREFGEVARETSEIVDTALPEPTASVSSYDLQLQQAQAAQFAAQCELRVANSKIEVLEAAVADAEARVTAAESRTHMAEEERDKAYAAVATESSSARVAKENEDKLREQLSLAQDDLCRMKARVSYLTSESGAQSEAMTALNGRVAELALANQTRESELVSLQDRFLQLTRERDEAQTARQDIQLQFDHFMAETRARLEAADKMEEELQQTRTILSDMKAHADTLTATLAEIGDPDREEKLIEERRALNQTISELTAAATSSEAAAQSAKTQLEEATAELADTKAALDLARTTLESMKQLSASHQEEIAELNGQIAAQRESTDAERTTMHSQIEAVTAQLATAVAEKETAEQMIATLRQERDAGRGEVTSLQNVINTLTLRQTDLLSCVNTSRSEAEQAETRAHDLSQKLALMEERVSAAEAAADHLRTQITVMKGIEAQRAALPDGAHTLGEMDGAEMQERIITLNAELTVLREKLEASSQREHSLKAELDARSAESLSQQLADLRRQNQILNESNDRLRDVTKALQTRANEPVRQLTAAKEQLATSEAARAAAQSEAQQAKTAVDQLRKREQELNAQLAELSRRNQHQRAELDQATQSKTALTRQIEQATKSSRAFQAQIQQLEAEIARLRTVKAAETRVATEKQTTNPFAIESSGSEAVAQEESKDPSTEPAGSGEAEVDASDSPFSLVSENSQEQQASNEKQSDVAEQQQYTGPIAERQRYLGLSTNLNDQESDSSTSNPFFVAFKETQSDQQSEGDMSGSLFSDLPGSSRPPSE